MKRREYGINLDDGVALSTEEEFRLLYVPCNPDETARLQGWFADDTQESLLMQTHGIPLQTKHYPGLRICMRQADCGRPVRS